MKKYLAILLTAALLLCAAPLAGFAAFDLPEWDFGGLFPFAHAAEIVASGNCGAEGDGSNVTWTLDSDGLLTISGSGEMQNYYNWNDSPWHNNTAIQTVIVQNGVTNIANIAFRNCMGLTSVTIPDSVTNIGWYAFEGCTSLASVNLPERVTSIGSSAFSGCTGLTSVTIPNSVTSIGNCAFMNCSRLTSVTIPDSVTTIGWEVFWNCTGLTSVTLPYSVTSLGDEVFSGCTGLIDLTVDVNNPVYFSVGNCIIEKESKTLIVGCQNSVIPDDGSVEAIGDHAFEGCTGLMSLIIPNSVTNIGNSAFLGCLGLTTMMIPDSVTSIGDEAFSCCTGLANLTVDANNPVYFSAGNCLIEKKSKTLVAGCKNSLIPNDDSVGTIGDYAFEGCAGLTALMIPDGVTSIGYAAFYNCTGLTTMMLPDSVTNIEECAFSGCTGLINLDVSANNPAYFSAGNCLIEKESKALVAGCKNSVIPSDGSVTCIGNCAFLGCMEMTSVTIPDSVTSIGDSAFEDCIGLMSLVIPDSVTSIGEYAFSGCTGLTSVTIPNSVMSIRNGTFQKCSGLSSVTIPNSVTSIGAVAFEDCTGLAIIVIPISIIEIDFDAIPTSAVIFGYAGSYAQQWAKKNNYVFMIIEEATVTLNAPEMVNEPSVNVYGFANPGADVVCSVNGTETIKVQAAANGRWNAEIPLPGAKDGDSFTVKAAVTVEDKTAEKTAAITYKPDAVFFEELTLNHSWYSVTFKGKRLGVSVPNFTFIPGQPLAFRIKVSNNDRVKKLSVVSTKDGDSRQMELTYDADSGYWFANGYFDNADENYIPGVFTVKGTDKDGKEFDAGVTIKINFLIDPSGYAYEAVTSNKLEGVTAAVYYKDAQGHELLWNAETADQLNPITTLSDGAFAWVVPEGQWQVRLTKPGYLEARSQWMDVPPEYTDVYLGMAAEAAPEVAYCNVYADRAEITFSQYMDLNTVNTDNVKFDGYTGAIVPLDAVEESEGSGNRYAKTFAFTPEKPFTGEIGVRIENAANYVGTVLASPYTATFTVAAEPKNLTATQDVSAVYGKTAEVTVSAENAAAKTVSVTCDSANVTLSDKTLTLDETGKATLSVTGEMPGIANLTFALDGTTLTAAAKASVTVPGVPAEPELPADPESPATPTDPENPATPTDPESPATPTDPENPATPTDPEGPDKPAYTLGDVDGDGEVSSGDARLALRASVQLEKYEKGSAAFLAADADKNGEIESSDARTILRVSVKLEAFV